MIVFYRLLGFGAIGLGVVNAIALLSSIYNPLLGISIFLPLGVGLVTWKGVLVWQLAKSEEENRQQILSDLGEAIGLFVLLILGIMAGVM
jgi:hypothetical protein